jgi:hypothetical protein
MAIKKKKISELTLSDNLKGLYTIGVKLINGVQTSVKVSLEYIQTAYENAVKATNSANTQANRAKEQADNPPKMGENGNWWKWDETQKKYVDTGILAKGGILYPTFTIDPDTMELIMYYQDDIAADMFDIDNEGFLIFNPK